MTTTKKSYFLVINYILSNHFLFYNVYLYFFFNNNFKVNACETEYKAQKLHASFNSIQLLLNGKKNAVDSFVWPEDSTLWPNVFSEPSSRIFHLNTFLLDIDRKGEIDTSLPVDSPNANNSMIQDGVFYQISLALTDCRVHLSQNLWSWTENFMDKIEILFCQPIISSYFYDLFNPNGTTEKVLFPFQLSLSINALAVSLLDDRYISNKNTIPIGIVFVMTCVQANLKRSLGLNLSSFLSETLNESIVEQSFKLVDQIKSPRSLFVRKDSFIFAQDLVEKEEKGTTQCVEGLKKKSSPVAVQNNLLIASINFQLLRCFFICQDALNNCVLPQSNAVLPSKDHHLIAAFDNVSFSFLKHQCAMSQQIEVNYRALEMNTRWSIALHYILNELSDAIKLHCRIFKERLTKVKKQLTSSKNISYTFSDDTMDTTDLRIKKTFDNSSVFALKFFVRNGKATLFGSSHYGVTLDTQELMLCQITPPQSLVNLCPFACQFLCLKLTLHNPPNMPLKPESLVVTNTLVKLMECRIAMNMTYSSSFPNHYIKWIEQTIQKHMKNEDQNFWAMDYRSDFQLLEEMWTDFNQHACNDPSSLMGDSKRGSATVLSPPVKIFAILKKIQVEQAPLSNFGGVMDNLSTQIRALKVCQDLPSKHKCVLKDSRTSISDETFSQNTQVVSVPEFGVQIGNIDFIILEEAVWSDISVADHCQKPLVHSPMHSESPIMNKRFIQIFSLSTSNVVFFLCPIFKPSTLHPLTEQCVIQFLHDQVSQLDSSSASTKELVRTHGFSSLLGSFIDVKANNVRLSLCDYKNPLFESTLVQVKGRLITAELKAPPWCVLRRQVRLGQWVDVRPLEVHAEKEENKHKYMDMDGRASEFILEETCRNFQFPLVNLRTTTCPTKLYHDLEVKIDESTICYGLCFSRALEKLSEAISRLSPQSLLSPAVPLRWWDKLRYQTHGLLQLIMKHGMTIKLLTQDPNAALSARILSQLVAVHIEKGKLHFELQHTMFEIPYPLMESVPNAQLYLLTPLAFPDLRISIALKWGFELNAAHKINPLSIQHSVNAPLQYDHYIQLDERYSINSKAVLASLLEEHEQDLLLSEILYQDLAVAWPDPFLDFRARSLDIAITVQLCRDLNGSRVLVPQLHVQWSAFPWILEYLFEFSQSNNDELDDEKTPKNPKQVRSHLQKFPASLTEIMSSVRILFAVHNPQINWWEKQESNNKLEIHAHKLHMFIHSQKGHDCDSLSTQLLCGLDEKGVEESSLSLEDEFFFAPESNHSNPTWKICQISTLMEDFRVFLTRHCSEEYISHCVNPSISSKIQDDNFFTFVPIKEIRKRFNFLAAQTQDPRVRKEFFISALRLKKNSQVASFLASKLPNPRATPPLLASLIQASEIASLLHDVESQAPWVTKAKFSEPFSSSFDIQAKGTFCLNPFDFEENHRMLRPPSNALPNLKLNESHPTDPLDTTRQIKSTVDSKSISDAFLHLSMYLFEVDPKIPTKQVVDSENGDNLSWFVDSLKMVYTVETRNALMRFVSSITRRGEDEIEEVDEIEEETKDKKELYGQFKNLNNLEDISNVAPDQHDSCLNQSTQIENSFVGFFLLFI